MGTQFAFIADFGRGKEEIDRVTLSVRTVSSLHTDHSHNMRPIVCLLLSATLAFVVASPVHDHIVLERDYNPVTGEYMPTIR